MYTHKFKPADVVVCHWDQYKPGHLFIGLVSDSITESYYCDGKPSLTVTVESLYGGMTTILFPIENITKIGEL